MIKYSIVIPTYGRNKFLEDCLASIEKQTIKPQDIFIIDNNENQEYRKSIKNIIEKYSSNEVNVSYHKGALNSGAVARNHGASLVSTELVAFLDDDVILDTDYYEKVIDVFEINKEVVGVQGLDWGFVENYEAKIQGKLKGQFWLFIENFFEASSIIKGKKSDVSPSLAVMHPIPNLDFCVESQWISTCAGVFKTNLFDHIEFPKHFVKYSWNEYLFFSYSIYKKGLGTMIYTSNARYRDVITSAGRLPVEELVYMSEVYDLYIFTELFNRNIWDKVIYIKSRLGRFAYYFVSTIKRKEFDLTLLSNVLKAFYFAFSNRKDIKKANFDCYNQKFPLKEEF